MTQKRPEDTEAAAVEESFIGRWSNRKLESQPNIALPDFKPQEPIGENAEEDHPTDADMAPIESLTEASDYSPFLSPKVSEHLRQLALRKLFRVPSFNLRDGLDDYDDDFTSFAPLGDLVTADLRHRLALEARKRAMAMVDDNPSDTARIEKTATSVDSPLADATAAEQQQPRDVPGPLETQEADERSDPL